MIIILFLISAALGAATDGNPPNCSYTCDDPICPAVCSATCASPNCTVSGCPSSTCQTPICFTQCLPLVNQSISDSCPSCETVCLPPQCSPVNVNCTVLCEAPVCGWSCRKPAVQDCNITCQLNCDMPAACGYSDASRLFVFPLLLIFSLIFF